MMGCYAMPAFNVNAFSMELQTDHTEKAPPVSDDKAFHRVWESARAYKPVIE